MTTSPDLELLKTFCNKGDRVGIALPFTIGAWTYFTDGKIMIRVPVIVPELGHPSHPKNPPELFGDNAHLEHRPIGAVPPPVMEPCEQCDGTGKIENNGHVTIGNQNVQLSLLRKVASLPNAHIANNADSELGPLHFVFDGGEGLLMPMRL